MSLEPFTSVAARGYLGRLRRAEATQRALLREILSASAGSPAARALGLPAALSFEEFLTVEPRDYSFYAPLVRQVLDGDAHAFGSDPITTLGETSGSSGQPKLIPHTEASLDCMRRFTQTVLLFQLWQTRTYLPRFTKWLCVSASTNVRTEGPVAIGFISGLMYSRAKNKRQGFVLPSPKVAAVADWEERIRQTAVEAFGQRVGTLFGVPAYLTRFLQHASERAGGRPLRTVWPLLDEVYYSGTGFEAHRPALEALLGRPVFARGLYTATEGVFAAELDWGAGGQLRLLPDMAVLTFRDVDRPGSRLLGMWELRPGPRYELMVTTRAGLVQYRIGDLLEVTQTEPLLVRVAGRAGDEINLATEKLSAKQAEAVMAETHAPLGLSADRFVVVPDPANPRRHLWFVEKLAENHAGAVEAALDLALARINPSYAALRAGDAVLLSPRVVVLPAGSFDPYLRHGFARRGQFKFRHVFPGGEHLRETAGLEVCLPHLEGSAP